MNSESAKYMYREALKTDVYMNMAHQISRMSRAHRLRVGCIMVKDGRIVATGFNGPPAGLPNECEYVDETTGHLVTKPEVLHAEENCIAFAARHGIKLDGCTAYCTDEPCFACSRKLIQAGIKEVYFGRYYKGTTSVSGVKLLEAAGIDVFFIDLNQLLV